MFSESLGQVSFVSEWSDYDEARQIHKILNETRASIKHMLVDFD